MSSDIIDYKIIGEDLQAVEIELDPQEGVRAEAGAMLLMEDGIEMQTNMDGGVFGGFKRMFTGESFFITTFLNSSNKKTKVTFAAPFPGKIIPIDLKEYNNKLICQKDSFLCCAQGNDVGILFNKKLGTGLFGGEGFILQTITGDGLTFIHAGGTIIKKELKHGETLRVDTGCLVGFSEGINYDIQMVKGFKNVLFGGEGLFLATLSGEGTVFIQTLPLSRLADRILHGRGVEQGSILGGIGNVIGGLE